MIAAVLVFFFFNDTATTEIYTLSLHDALPISNRRLPRAVHALHPLRRAGPRRRLPLLARPGARWRVRGGDGPDRKSTRLNSSHANISYAVFCLKKKKITAKMLSHISMTSIYTL